MLCHEREGGQARTDAGIRPDRAVGWTPDGKRVMFTSIRDNETGSFGGRLYTIRSKAAIRGAAVAAR